jgi:hypothetical protein
LDRSMLRNAVLPQSRKPELSHRTPRRGSGLGSTRHRVTSPAKVTSRESPAEWAKIAAAATPLGYRPAPEIVLAPARVHPKASGGFARVPAPTRSHGWVGVAEFEPLRGWPPACSPIRSRTPPVPSRPPGSCCRSPRRRSGPLPRLRSRQAPAPTATPALQGGSLPLTCIERWRGELRAARPCRGQPSGASRSQDPGCCDQGSAYVPRSFREDNVPGASSEKAWRPPSPIAARRRSPACRRRVPTVRSETPRAAAISRLL